MRRSGLLEVLNEQGRLPVQVRYAGVFTVRAQVVSEEAEAGRGAGAVSEQAVPDPAMEGRGRGEGAEGGGEVTGKKVAPTDAHPQGTCCMQWERDGKDHSYACWQMRRNADPKAYEGKEPEWPPMITGAPLKGPSS